MNVQPINNALKSFFSSPSIKQTIKRVLIISTHNPRVIEEVEKGAAEIVKFASSLKLDISFKIKESEFIIEKTNKIQINKYTTGDVSNSSVIQGNDININKNISINIVITQDQLKQLIELTDNLKNLRSKLPVKINSEELKETNRILNDINDKFKILNNQLEVILLKVTDVSLLRQGLSLI